MLEHSSLQKIVVVLSVVTLFLLLGVGGMTWILFGKQNEFMQSEKTVSSKTQDEYLRAQYKAILNRTLTKRATLETYMIHGDADTARLLETIEKNASERNLSITETINVEKVTSTTKALVINLETKGDYQNVMQFLASLEALPHEALFRDVALRRSSELAQKNASWTLDVSLLIKSFQP